MRKLLLAIFVACTLTTYGQIIIPQGYLYKNDHLDAAFLPTAAGAKSTFTGKRNFFPSFRSDVCSELEEMNSLFLQNNIISYNNNFSNVALYSEIASDFIGPIRASTGITLAYPKTDEDAVEQMLLNKKSFLQKFSTGGGSISINFILPVMTYKNKSLSIDWYAGPRFSLDPPAFGISTDKFAHNSALGSDLQFSLTGLRNVIKFTGGLRLSKVFGNSAFYDALDLTEDGRKSFSLNNTTVGMIITDKFSISYTHFFGTEVVVSKLKSFLTFTVSPNFDKL